jgi:hypothetical protein
LGESACRLSTLFVQHTTPSNGKGIELPDDGGLDLHGLVHQAGADLCPKFGRVRMAMARDRVGYSAFHDVFLAARDVQVTIIDARKLAAISDFS